MNISWKPTSVFGRQPAIAAMTAARVEEPRFSRAKPVSLNEIQVHLSILWLEQ
jgi:hypothetical protein